MKKTECQDCEEIFIARDNFDLYCENCAEDRYIQTQNDNFTRYWEGE